MINIDDKAKCCGCTACYNICPKKCISMTEDEEGFLYPIVNTDNCINCDLCNKVCPVINHKETDINKYQTAAIMQHKNKDVLKQSTAGGAFTAIAEYVIQNGGIVFGVEMTENYFVQHTSVENVNDLYKYRNSKYVQSYVGNSFENVRNELNKGILVCFSGTPCQIEGLRYYLQRDYENLILVDVVCRAVPSPGVWKRYIEMKVSEKGTMKSIRFRDKSLGYQYSTMEMKSADGTVYRGGIESDPWLRMFFSGMIIRPSCSACKFRSRYRNSDFTIWDCFNSYSIEKSFDENIGTTRMLIHSKKGQEIFNKIKTQTDCVLINPDVAVNGVKEMIKSPLINSQHELFFKDYSTMDMNLLISKYYPDSLKVKLKRKARIILNYFGLDRVIKHILKKG